jgi:hypothetical protein
VAQAAGRHAAGVAARAPLHHATRLHALRPLGPRHRHLISRAATKPPPFQPLKVVLAAYNEASATDSAPLAAV